MGAVMCLRSKGDDDAVVRIISDPLLRAIAEFGGAPPQVVPPANWPAAMAQCRIVLFHYDDHPAIEALRAAPPPADAITICLGSDVYNYTEYLDLSDIVSFFLMPSEIHTSILSAQLLRPVYTLGETVDTAAIGRGEPTWPVGRFQDRKPRLLWFGYPESFIKSMASLMPVINHAVDTGVVDSFTIMTKTADFRLPGKWSLVEYSQARFRDDMLAYDYAILSHLALDLRLNTMIKSPNKVISSLAAGVIPLASRTPNYESVMQEAGLAEFLFGSPRELHALLHRLRPVEDAQRVAQAGAIRVTRATSLQDLYRTFAACLDRFEAERDPDFEQLQPATPESFLPKPSFKRRVARKVLATLRGW